MDKSQQGHKDIDEDSEAETTTARSGWWLRKKSSIFHCIANRLGYTIDFLQHQRERLEPIEEGGEENKHARGTEPPDIPKAVTSRRPLLTFLIGVVVVLLGIFSGALFSFNLFAQKMESQGDFIASQADKVFEYDKETQRAERALEKSKSENKELQLQFEEVRAELQQAKTRLAEIEGRAALYGNKQDFLEPSKVQGSPSSVPQHASRYRSKQVPNRTCDLGSGSASTDLSRCLRQAK